MISLLLVLDNPSFVGVCAEMKNNLNAWFDYMMDETMDTFDSIYLLATELQPNYRLFVSGEPHYSKYSDKTHQ